MPNAKPSFGRIRTMAQDMETARQKQQKKQTKVSSPLGREPLGGEEDILAKFRKKPPSFGKPEIPSQESAKTPKKPAEPGLKLRRIPPVPPPISSSKTLGEARPPTPSGEPPAHLPGAEEKPKIFEQLPRRVPPPAALPGVKPVGETAPKPKKPLLPIEEEETGKMQLLQPLKPVRKITPPEPKGPILPIEEEVPTGAVEPPMQKAVPPKTPEEILGIGKPPTPPILEKPSPPKAAPPLKPEAPLAFWRRSPFIISVASIGFVLMLLGGLIYWQIFLNKPPTEPPAPPSPAEIQIPAPYFTTEDETLIQIVRGQEQFLIEQIRAFKYSPDTEKSITHLPIQKIPEESFLNTKELFELLEISLPNNFFESLDEKFMLYGYTPGEEEAVRCQEEGFTDIACSSPRLGLVLPILPGKTDVLRAFLADFENEFLQAMRPLILGSPKYPDAPQWNTTVYEGFTLSSPQTVDVRYINLPISTTTLNYAIFEDFLIIATSKHSNYFALDQLVKRPREE